MYLERLSEFVCPVEGLVDPGHLCLPAPALLADEPRDPICITMQAAGSMFDFVIELTEGLYPAGKHTLWALEGP